jgi:hypothetical protein
MRNAFKILVGKSEERRKLGRSRSRQKNNIRLDLKEIDWESVDWMHLAQDRDQWRTLVKTVINFRVP